MGAMVNPALGWIAALTISHVALANDQLGSIRIGASRDRYVGACPQPRQIKEHRSAFSGSITISFVVRESWN